MRKFLLVAGATLVALAASASARPQDRGGPPPHRGPPIDGRMLARAADADRSRDVTAEEWAAFKDSVAVDADGAVDLTALAEQLGLRAPPAHRGEEPPAIEDILAERLDADDDGTVTLADFDALFAALDNDADGALSGADRPDPTHPMGRHARRGGRFVLAVADADESGDVTADEWQGFLDSLEVDENGAVDAMALLALLPPPPEGSRCADKTDEERAARLTRILDRDRDGVVEVSDIQAAFDQLDADGDGALSADELARQRPV